MITQQATGRAYRFPADTIGDFEEQESCEVREEPVLAWSLEELDEFSDLGGRHSSPDGDDRHA